MEAKIGKIVGRCVTSSRWLDAGSALLFLAVVVAAPLYANGSTSLDGYATLSRQAITPQTDRVREWPIACARGSLHGYESYEIGHDFARESACFRPLRLA